MATCKENCIHYSVCGIWDRKVFVDYEKDIMSDFSDLPNVEEYCRNYFPKQTEAEWIPTITTSPKYGVPVFVGFTCSSCLTKQKVNTNYCSFCGQKMVERR